MNKPILTITAAVSSLFAVSTASADLQGISIDESLTAYGTTFSVFASVDEGDQVDAIFGDSVDTLTIGSDNGFYQNMFGSHKAPSEALFGFFPSLRYDSFVTIGLDTDAGNAMLDIGVDWTIFEGDVISGSHYDGANIETNNGSWFATPDDAQVFEVDGRVLLGQFTVEFGDHVYGEINIQGKNADLSNWQYRGVTFDSAIVPAPGAIALLGLAGVCARRRRK
ncbi:MAG: PEP-CTERM sorting domain-containing protein [Phycisphaerae bacterium]|nr:PEP-CTERM sorting domain-containing protein [Phycisphaerae bacterium]